MSDWLDEVMEISDRAAQMNATARRGGLEQATARVQSAFLDWRSADIRYWETYKTDPYKSVVENMNAAHAWVVFCDALRSLTQEAKL